AVGHLAGHLCLRAPPRRASAQAGAMPDRRMREQMTDTSIGARDGAGGPARKIRYAVVGAGWSAQNAFMPGVKRTGNSVMAAIVTGDPAKAEGLGGLYRIRHRYSYDEYDRLLASGEVDAVYLATPNTLHCDFAIRAMKAGLHVLCEKPLAAN